MNAWRIQVVEASSPERSRKSTLSRVEVVIVCVVFDRSTLTAPHEGVIGCSATTTTLPARYAVTLRVEPASIPAGSMATLWLAAPAECVTVRLAPPTSIRIWSESRAKSGKWRVSWVTQAPSRHPARQMASASHRIH